MDKQITGIVNDTWVKRILTYTLTGDTPAEHRLSWQIDHAARAALEDELFGKRVLVTGHNDWAVVDVVAGYRSQPDAEFGFRQLKDPHVVSFSPTLPATVSVTNRSAGTRCSTCSLGSTHPGPTSTASTYSTCTDSSAPSSPALRPPANTSGSAVSRSTSSPPSTAPHVSQGGARTTVPTRGRTGSTSMSRAARANRQFSLHVTAGGRKVYSG